MEKGCQPPRRPAGLIDPPPPPPPPPPLPPLDLAFSAIPCESFQDETKSLREDHSISCLDPTYQLMRVYSVLMM